MAEVSSTRLYLGNLPRTATKDDVQKHFQNHSNGEITEIKLMNGFGFIEYKDPMDARDIVPACHGSVLLGERLTVQFARGTRNRDTGGGNGGAYGNSDRSAPPRPRRTQYRMQITGLPTDTSWQDLKDFARQSHLDVVYSETGRNNNGEGFVEFESAADLNSAVEALDGKEFKERTVRCTANIQSEPPPRERGRSRSPGRRSYAPPAGDDYERRGPPPHAYSPRRDGYRDGYRERTPPRRDYYDDRSRYRSPPRRGPVDDYPPPRARYEEPYRRDYPPPEPYANGRPYDRPPPRDFPPRESGYPRDGGYPRDYERPSRY